MYHHLKGLVTHREPTYLIVECSGVGYHVKTSLSSSSQFAVGQIATVYTHLQVREDALTLFGFASPQERDMFVVLLEVSGVGSATAVCILSSLNPVEIYQAAISEDERRFQAVKGIGIKTAKRLILDLKDKLSKLNWDSVSTVATTPSSSAQEAVAALMALGFAKNIAEKQVQALLKQTSELLTTEEIIRMCLVA